jgi:hypothetical protein
LLHTRSDEDTVKTTCTASDVAHYDRQDWSDGCLRVPGLDDITPHDLRRTPACILEQLGYSDAAIGRVMTHKIADKEAARVTREHYLVPVQIVTRRVDPRVKALDDLDAALREIIGPGPHKLRPVA